MKVTIDLDAERYRAIKVEAARTDRSVRDVVDEALEAWLEASETREDRRLPRKPRRVPSRRRRGGRCLLRDSRRRNPVDVRFRRGVTESRYRVELAPAAQRQLRRLPPGGAARLRGPILALAISLDRVEQSSSLAPTSGGFASVTSDMLPDRRQGPPRRRPQGRPSLGEHVPTGGLTCHREEGSLGLQRPQGGFRGPRSVPSTRCNRRRRAGPCTSCSARRPLRQGTIHRR